MYIYTYIYTHINHIYIYNFCCTSMMVTVIISGLIDGQKPMLPIQYKCAFLTTQRLANKTCESVLKANTERPPHSHEFPIPLLGDRVGTIICSIEGPRNYGRTPLAPRWKRRLVEVETCGQICKRHWPPRWLWHQSPCPSPSLRRCQAKAVS